MKGKFQLLEKGKKSQMSHPIVMSLPPLLESIHKERRAAAFTLTRLIYSVYNSSLPSDK